MLIYCTIDAANVLREDRQRFQSMVTRAMKGGNIGGVTFDAVTR